MGRLAPRSDRMSLLFFYCEGNTLKQEHKSRLNVDDFLARLRSKVLGVSREWGRVAYLLKNVHGLQNAALSMHSCKDPTRHLTESFRGSERDQAKESDRVCGVNTMSKIESAIEDGEIGNELEAIIEHALQSGCVDLTRLPIKELMLVGRIWENSRWCKSFVHVYSSRWKARMLEVMCRGEISAKHPTTKSIITQRIRANVLEHPELVLSCTDCTSKSGLRFN